jgi:hypothetical protein
MLAGKCLKISISSIQLRRNLYFRVVDTVDLDPDPAF